MSPLRGKTKHKARSRACSIVASSNPTNVGRPSAAPSLLTSFSDLRSGKRRQMSFSKFCIVLGGKCYNLTAQTQLIVDVRTFTSSHRSRPGCGKNQPCDPKCATGNWDIPSVHAFIPCSNFDEFAPGKLMDGLQRPFLGQPNNKYVLK